MMTTGDKALILHNPRCSKSRSALKLLQENGIPYEEIRYLDNPPSENFLSTLLDLLGVEPEAIVRKNEQVYKELGLKDKTLSREEWIKILHEYPRLIERPIVVYKGRAVVGRPPEKVLELIND